MKNKKRIIYWCLFVLFAGLAYSCQNRPNEVLSRKQMEQLMYDVYIAEATMETDYQNFDTPEKKEAYINRVFQLHKTNQEQWDTSLSWYSDRIDLYLKMNDSVKARLQRYRLELEALVAEQAKVQQTDPSLLPLSYLPPIYSFSIPDTRRGFRFRLDSTEIGSKIQGDDFRFAFSTIGIPPGFLSTFQSVLALVYSDTTIYRFEKINENRTYELCGSKYIPEDTITEIRGFVHIQDSISLTPHIQLYNISLEGTDSAFVEPDTLKADEIIPDTLNVMPDSIRQISEMPDRQK